METVMQRITIPSKIKLQEIARLITERSGQRETSVDVLETLIEQEYRRLVDQGIITPAAAPVEEE